MSWFGVQLVPAVPSREFTRLPCWWLKIQKAKLSRGTLQLCDLEPPKLWSKRWRSKCPRCFNLSSEIPISRLTEMFNVNNFIVSHVPSIFAFNFPKLPFSIVGWFFRWLMDEFQHRLFQLKELGLIPQRLLRIEQALRTPDVGDIQISPKIFLSDSSYLFANPTKQFIKYCMAKGERATWEHISQIEIRCAVEFELERMIKILKNRRIAKGWLVELEAVVNKSKKIDTADIALISHGRNPLSAQIPKCQSMKS